MKDRRRNLRSYRDKVAKEKAKALKAREVICHLCLEPIDMTLPYHDAMAWTLDHLDALATGGHILGKTMPAHRSCNSRKGDGTKQDHLKASVPKWF
jgi:hypothetical protein